jgi:hypothetical protein
MPMVNCSREKHSWVFLILEVEIVFSLLHICYMGIYLHENNAYIFSIFFSVMSKIIVVFELLCSDMCYVYVASCVEIQLLSAIGCCGCSCCITAQTPNTVKE